MKYAVMYVPEGREGEFEKHTDYLTPGKHYPVIKLGKDICRTIDDDEEVRIILLDGCAHLLEGMSWEFHDTEGQV